MRWFISSVWLAHEYLKFFFKMSLLFVATFLVFQQVVQAGWSVFGSSVYLEE